MVKERRRIQGQRGEESRDKSALCYIQLHQFTEERLWCNISVIELLWQFIKFINWTVYEDLLTASDHWKKILPASFSCKGYSNLSDERMYTCSFSPYLGKGLAVMYWRNSEGLQTHSMCFDMWGVMWGASLSEVLLTAWKQNWQVSFIHELTPKLQLKIWTMPEW